MKTPVFLLLVILASLLGMAVSQNRTDPAWIESQKKLEQWCKLNLGPAWGGRCRK
ncbi:ductus ejaculatorius peptide 99B [Drosophila yakuba]|uniref:Uncharacterized protein n=1 Tax=Drosophila yakuba TaxID=7245 RepID=B4PPM2_DROYA|nr:ductus ejaculatorius peptide 99B [Drosophila yakuba]EDW98272.1 uncharacterized protein Dyak_GE10438 [Drosophila yakuba]